MIKGWARVSKRVAAVTAAAMSLLIVGCGPAPGYEPEPAYPVAPPPPRPLSAAELSSRAPVVAEQEPAAVDLAEGDEYADTDPSALTEFRPVLEPHGAWVDDGTYGTVWIPHEEVVGPDFQPYVTAGHWAYEDEWIWVSDYDWGWAPFHYGRWVHLPGRGWAWIPGRRYAGAWVTWRTGPVGYGYVGWAPAPPSWYWYDGVALGWGFGWYHPPFVYCSTAYIHRPYVGTYVVRGAAARAHDARTRPYAPASPGVAGSGRVLAKPGVGGGDRVVASPSVAGAREIARPGVGPRPEAIGAEREMLASPPRANPGFARAQALASPRTAVAVGARPPTPSRASAFQTAPGRAGQGSAPGPLPPRATESSPRLAPGHVAPLPPRAYSERPSPSPAPAFRPPPSVERTPPAVRTRPSVERTPPAFRPPPSVERTPPTVRTPPSVERTPPPAVRTPPPAVRTPPPAVRTPPPVVRTPPPAGRTPPPAVRTPPPAVRTPPPAVRTPPPAVRTRPPAMRTPPPAVRTPPPAVRTPPPAVRTPPPAVRTPRSSVQTPPRSSYRSAPAARSAPRVQSVPRSSSRSTPATRSSPSRSGGGSRRR
jgi:hypothetical protein